MQKTYRLILMPLNLGGKANEEQILGSHFVSMW